MKDSSTQTENNNNQDSLINISVMMVKLLKINSEMDVSKNPAKALEILIKMLGLTVDDNQLENIIDREFNKDGDNEILSNSKKNTKNTEITKGRKRPSNNIDGADEAEISDTETQETYNSHTNERNVKTKYDNNKKKGKKWK